MRSRVLHVGVLGYADVFKKHMKNAFEKSEYYIIKKLGIRNAANILDLEKFQTDIGLYLRNIEEVVIETIAEWGIKGERSKGETGVWIDTAIPGRERKICAIGVRCSRWITMHGFALNVNTDLGFFNNIVPCGIQDKKVASIEKEIGYQPDIELVKEKIKKNFEKVFNVALV